MKIMSFNLLCAGSGKYSFENRAPLVVQTILDEKPDTFGVQEAHEEWMAILAKAFPGYAYEGIGRDNGKNKGEYSAVFYRTDRFEKISSGSFFLSQHPNKKGLGWDAMCPRTCSWVMLRDKVTDKPFVHMNTHLDHKGTLARIEGMKLIASKTAEFNSDIPILITGDFNAEPDSEVYSIAKALGFADARGAAEKSDTAPTYHEYCGLAETIDYIFARNVARIAEFKVVRTEYGGIYPSDHFPITAVWE